MPEVTTELAAIWNTNRHHTTNNPILVLFHRLRFCLCWLMCMQLTNESIPLGTTCRFRGPQTHV